MRYGMGGFCHWHVQSARGGGTIYSGMRRRASDSGGLSEDLSGLRRAEGLEGQAALGHAVARELPGDRGHELLGSACVEINSDDAIDATLSP